MPKFAHLTLFLLGAAASPQLFTFNIFQRNTIMRHWSGIYREIFKSGSKNMLTLVIQNDAFCDYVIFGKPHSDLT